MRYPAVLACSLLVLVSACSFDDGSEPERDSSTAVAGQELVADIGICRVTISPLAIGTGTGQLEPGSRVKLKVVEQEFSGRTRYSPVVDITVLKPDGTAATGLALSPAAVVELSYDYNLAMQEGFDSTKLAFLKVNGTTVTQLTYTTAAPAADSQFTLGGPGRARALLTSFSRVAMATKTGTTTPGTPTALTGTVSTLLTSTVFQLANTGGTISVNLAVPTADTTTVPAVLTLNDASFDSTNPLSATNRIVSVTASGVTYTSDNAAAGVTCQINTFSASASSGSLVGTVIQQGGSATLSINYTWTTGTAGATALGGTATDILGRRTLSLQDAAQTAQLTILMPDTLPDGTLSPITFNDASYDSGNPLDANGRIVTLTESGTTYTSDVAVVGSVTLTFTSWNSSTKVGAGTITGTVVSATPSTKTLNYTFTTTAGSGTGATGTFAAGTPVDVTTTDTADESAVVYDGANYVAVWMSDIGVTRRTIEFVSLNPATLAAGTQRSVEPAAALVPAGGFAAAVETGDDVLVVGATGSSSSDSVVGVLYDYAGATLVLEFAVGTGTAPRVVFNTQGNAFVVAWQAGAAVKARAFTPAGVAIGTEQTVFATATLKGLAAAGGSNDNVLVTADDGSGIAGRYITPSTGALGATSFDLSTAESGGLCAWDTVGSQYLVITEAVVGGFFTSQVVKALAAGGTTPLTGTLTLAALNAMLQAADGNAGVVFASLGANLYGVDSSASGPAQVATPLVGAATGLNVDTTADGGALAASGSNRYVLVAAKGAAGVTAIPLTLTP
ncbi:MAG: hypothetical protein IT463_07265 [Planctomycetes bacterium]|nr:hypothetical protein [Planctomycetota bacterium]